MAYLTRTLAAQILSNCMMQGTAGLVSSFEISICRKGIRVAARSTETFGCTMALDT